MAEREPIQGDAGVDCPCGGRMLYKTPSGGDVACPRCGLTPLDLVSQSRTRAYTPDSGPQQSDARVSGASSTHWPESNRRTKP